MAQQWHQGHCNSGLHKRLVYDGGAGRLGLATPQDGVEATAVLAEAISAIDRAAKAGAIHPNAAARRKSRLTRKVNAALAGAEVSTSAQ